MRISTAALFLTTIVLVAFDPASAQRRPAATESPSITAELPAQLPDQGYVGEERCQSCHKSELTEFHKTPHARLDSDRTKQRMNCETCHGAGKAHADAEEAAQGDDDKTAAANRLIFAFRGTPAANAARCLTCHASGERQQQFGHSQHVAVGVACHACHSTHLTRQAAASVTANQPSPQARVFALPDLDSERRWLRESLLKESQPGLCYSCHASQRAQFAQPFHHRVPEGSMKCTDCHSVHGTLDRALLAKPGWETCTSCHADKRGPFVFEHAPVRVEGCVACHTPHGSASRFMLARRESRFLCLQCHGDQPSGAVNVPHGRLSFQTRGDCVRCHVSIHGSNFNVNFLQ